LTLLGTLSEREPAVGPWIVGGVSVVVVVVREMAMLAAYVSRREGKTTGGWRERPFVPYV
jgi:hypothetical protein